jgi:hypothetical protein
MRWREIIIAPRRANLFFGYQMLEIAHLHFTGIFDKCPQLLVRYI